MYHLCHNIKCIVFDICSCTVIVLVNDSDVGKQWKTNWVSSVQMEKRKKDTFLLKLLERNKMRLK